MQASGHGKLAGECKGMDVVVNVKATKCIANSWGAACMHIVSNCWHSLPSLLLEQHNCHVLASVPTESVLALTPSTLCFAALCALGLCYGAQTPDEYMPGLCLCGLFGTSSRTQSNESVHEPIQQVTAGTPSVLATPPARLVDQKSQAGTDAPIEAHTHTPAAMEVRVREEVLNYGLLPVNVLLPQLDSLSSLCTIHKRLAATAVKDEHGESECDTRHAL